VRGRRGATTTFAALALTAIAVLTGCQVSNTPTGYDTPEQGTIVQTNYLAACTGNLPSDAGTTTTIAPMDQCACQYKIFVDQVPFDDNAKKTDPRFANWGDNPTFTSLENDLRTDTNAFDKLPSNIKQQLIDCGKAQQGPAAPGTTAVATAGSTPAGTTPR
jgi:hypothetical protein